MNLKKKGELLTIFESKIFGSHLLGGRGDR